MLASQSVRSTIHEWIEDSVHIPKNRPAHLKELSGDTLTASEAGDCPHSHEQEAFRDTKSLASASQATENVRNHDPFESPSTVSKSKAPHKSLKHDLSTTEALRTRGIDSEQDICSTESGYSQSPGINEKKAEHSLYQAQVLPYPPEWPSPTADKWPVKAFRRMSTKRRKKLQRIIAYRHKRALDTPTHRPRNPATVPRQSGFCQYSSFNRCTVSKTSPRSYSSSKSLDRASEQRFDVVSSSKYDPSKYYGCRPLSVPLINRPLTRSRQPSGSLQVTAVSLDFKSSPSTGYHYIHEVDAPLSMLSASQKPTPLSACLASPNESPNSWLGRSFCSAEWFSLGKGAHEKSPCQSSSNASESKVADGVKSGLGIVASKRSHSIDSLIHTSGTAPPSTVLSDGRIYVCFPKDMSTGIYEVQLDTDVFLSRPNALHWQSFGIPSLLAEECSDVNGIIDFSIAPHADNDAGAAPAQFDAINRVVFQDVHERRLKGSFPVHQMFLLRVRLRVESHRIERWNGSVTIYSTMCDKQGLGMNIKHSSSVIIELPWEDIFAKRLIFALLIRNGPRNAGLYRLKSGQCLIQLPECEYAASEPYDTAEILIERDYQDMDKRLEVRFTCSYPDIKEASIALPVISPKLGEVFSERTWLLIPSPPLKIHAVSKHSLNTWDISKRTVGKRELLCFNRMEMPTLYPDDIADDAVVRLRRLHPVLFNGFPDPSEDIINNEGSCNIIPSLNMVVDIIPGKRLECRMFFDLEVAGHQRLVRIDALGWQPKYALVNGHLCTKQNARWWNEDFQIGLFQDSWMAPGQRLQIEMSFVVNSRFVEFKFSRERGDWVETCYPLPRITDKIIHGGTMSCSYDNAVIGVVRNCSASPDYEELRFFSSYGEDSRPLPSVNRDHKLHIAFWMLHPLKLDQFKPSRPSSKGGHIQLARGLPLNARMVHFESEGPDTSNDGDDEFDDCNSSSIRLASRSRRALRRTTAERARPTRASKQQKDGKHTTGVQCRGDSYSGFGSIIKVAGKDSSGSEAENTSDCPGAKDPDISTGRHPITDSGAIVRSGAQSGADAMTKDFLDNDSRNDRDGHSLDNRDSNSSAAGEDTLDSSDEHDSDAAGQDAFSGEDEDAELEAGEDEDRGGEVIDYLIDAVLHLVRYLERRSPMQYLIRFLILACIICPRMPRGYFGGQTARAVQEVVSNIFTHPQQMFLGDLDMPMQPTSDAELDEIPLVLEPAAVHRVFERDLAEETTVRPRSQSFRDRIDLGLGWRPVP
ncbi:MAG: hypothetical protein Q9225_004401 [Loekoesia sp. 1 TL-2023]